MSISQDWITNELEDTELEALHRSPSVEYSFYNAVRAGDMEAVNKNCEEDSFLHLKEPVSSPKSSDQPEVSFRCHYCHAHPLLY